MKKPAIPVGMCPIVAQEAKLRRERQQAKQINLIPGLIVLPNQTKKSTNTPKNQTDCGTSSIKKSSSSTKSKSNKSNNNPIDDNTLNNAMDNLNVSSEEELAKKLKKLRKKIREIEAIEAKLDSGELKKPEQDQLDKIARKEQILDELDNLEQLEKAQ